MAASLIPPEVFEMILQFAPDNSFVGFKVDKRELQEDAKITIRENQFGPISIRCPNQLRLLSRTALAYVRRWKSSKLLCEIWIKSDQEDFSMAEVELSFLHSNAVPLVGHINRESYLSEWGKWLFQSNPRHYAKTVVFPTEGAFTGLEDLASSYYSEQIAQIELHVNIPASSDHLAQFCRWFHCFWLYVLEKIPSAADLPTFVDLTCDERALRKMRFFRPDLVEQNWSERGVFEEMPNNFQLLNFIDFPGVHFSEPLLSGSADFIFNAGRATINHLAGYLPAILSLGFQPGAAAASFPAVKQIHATSNENLDFSGGVNPFAQLVSLFPSLESLNLYPIGVRNNQAITMDLSPLLQNPNLRHFQFDGYDWMHSYVEQFANEPLNRWNISHPGVRSIRLAGDLNLDSDDMPAEQIVALRKLLNLNAASYESLDLHNMFCVRQFLAIFDAYTIFPKVASLRRLSLDIKFTIQTDTEEWLESIFRLFALIERTMPHLSALCFGATMYSVDRVAPDTGAFEFARSPEISLLSRFVANRPKQLKELTLCGILQGPDATHAGNDEWLLCTLRCLIESKLSCLMVSEAPLGVSWPSSFFRRWNANSGSIKDLFKSLPPAASKGKRLQSVKFYTHKRQVRFPDKHDPSNMRNCHQAVELCCDLADASTGETQTLRLRPGMHLFD